MRTYNRSTQFQFHYGTIKRQIARIAVTTISNFNSTMVRLKDKCKDGVPFWTLFQFHYGTIKSLQPYY